MFFKVVMGKKPVPPDRLDGFVNLVLAQKRIMPVIAGDPVRIIPVELLQER
jgi:hypothetical protein